ncbi:hypothetical protein [Paraburkholderia acidisoli]|uniref:Uncharacterized protein n=1 Tax=Paraburkholderia acidisoli TaxID=2571748 RepID=A0A7Z2JEZ6_9BURK|nr:hypothetical protein [Paraburkholderia acidisoli]QGZ61418.1 hypothetical protein FAZ98_06550 [Paraburkholderia acidisoli]
MNTRKQAINNERPNATGAEQDRPAQKPVGAIFVDALALSRATRKQTAQSSVTNLTFHTGATVTIHLKDGVFDIDTKECIASMIDSNDGASVVIMLSPAPSAA